MTHDPIIRDRVWLRSFVNLGNRAVADGIPASDIERQEDTVLRACQMLKEQPGVVLADEVGMGKTFEALGVAAFFHRENKRSRIVVLTPGPDLNTKWVKEFEKFPYKFGKCSGAVKEARTLSDFVAAVKVSPITIAPVTMFQSGRGASEQAYLLSLYCHSKGLHGNKANALISRALGEHACRVGIDDKLFLGEFKFLEIQDSLTGAFKKLDKLYESESLAGFENQRKVRRLLSVARSAIARSLLKNIDLLIVDEAHKLKNPESLRSEAIQTVFRKKFRKALFLTATPFQLHTSELKQIFAVFAQAKHAPANLMDTWEALRVHICDYQSLCDEFQMTWNSLEPEFAAQFSAAYDRSQEDVERIDDPSSRILLSQIDQLSESKKTIQCGLRQWMIRSLREEKRLYRKDFPKALPTSGPGCLPFLIYERFIAELFRRQHQTHKVAAEINMVSSWAAARSGAIIKNEGEIPEQAEPYRTLLRRLLRQIRSTDASCDHPKLAYVISDAIAAAMQGEKTLIFCSRIETLKELARELDHEWMSQILDRWRLVFPHATKEDVFGEHADGIDRKGRHANLQSRFDSTHDALYLALREPYLYTVKPLAQWAKDHLDEIIAEANVLLGKLWVGKTAAERIDYQLAKRCVEQATVHHWRKAHPEQSVSDELHRLSAPEFLTLGLDLHSDELEADTRGDHQPHWTITERSASLVIGQPGSLWERLSTEFIGMPCELRVRVVEQLARYVTSRQVPFIAELLKAAHTAGIFLDTVKSDELLGFMPDFWTSEEGASWQIKLREFLGYFKSRRLHAGESTDGENLQFEQDSILNGLRDQREIKFARHTEDRRSREKLREAFTTPLFPMVLIANEVMQEGIDLHKQCRRIVHHDLVWNPAQIEQRIGRIDRLGSLTSRLRATNSSATLDVLYPVIEGTIDQRLYRTVKTREKWLEFLLGAPRNFDDDNFNGTPPSPIPNRLAAELRIDLSPSLSFEQQPHGM